MEQEKSAKKNKGAGRGIETLFRLLSKNHYTLSELVDKKASILISVNAIILSIVIGTVMRRLGDDPHLLVPVVMISLTNLGSIALAVFAAKPIRTHHQGVEGHTVLDANLLFFGDFQGLSEQQYLEGVNGLMDDKDKLYDSLSRDVYHMGRALKTKFDLITRSMGIFIYGLVASVLTFIFCHMFFGSAAIFPIF